MRILDVAGSPAKMGESFGEACREDIRGLYAARLSNAVEQARSYGGRSIDEAWLLRAADEALGVVASFSQPGFEELCGIARGAGLGPNQIWAMNALTDLRDFAAYGPEHRGSAPPVDGEGCTSIVVPAARAAGGAALGAQTWDLSTDNMPFVCVLRRRPQDGLRTVALTTTGCLTLIGLNEAGVGVGTTNLRTTDVRLGVGYLDVLHAAIAAPDLVAAEAAVRRATRMGAHYFWAVDAREGRAMEGSARQLHVRSVHSAAYGHTNHALEAEVAALEAPNTPMASSHHRQRRLQALVAERETLGVDDLKALLADTDGEALAINRRDFAGISTNGAVVLEPAAARVHVVHGPAADNPWQTLEV